MIVKIHSISYLAMNSSGTVYFTATGCFIERGHAAINAILKTAGCDKKSEDLFDISSCPDAGRMVDYINDWHSEHEGQDDLAEDDLAEEESKFHSVTAEMMALEYSDMMKYFKSKIWGIPENKDLFKKFISYEDDEIDDNISITSKDGTSEDIFGIIYDMFNVEGGYDG